MKIRTQGDRIVVEPIDDETSRQAVQDFEPKKGRVIAVGDIPRVHEGDVVHYSLSGATEVDLGEKTLVVLDESNLLSIDAEDHPDHRRDELAALTPGLHAAPADTENKPIELTVSGQDLEILRKEVQELRDGVEADIIELRRLAS
jgi:co-chaperonin GroES (HSP10)